MRLATLKDKHSRDGKLVLINKERTHFVDATPIAPNLREAIETWSVTSAKLKELQLNLDSGKIAAQQKIDWSLFHSPLPRSFQWIDGSAFIQHVKLVRKARGAELPPNLLTTPLIYQGGSDSFLAPLEDIPQIDFAHGTDFEGEIAVILDETPMAITPEEALKKIILVVICNDVSLRGLIPEELAMGFGFFQSKPSSAFGPISLTPDELGDRWKDGRLHLPLIVNYNKQFFGKANAGEMHFNFGQIIAHAARTRSLAAGTIIGSGTVSNVDVTMGSSCLAEKRMLEQINEGKIVTPFMKVGDTIEICVKDERGVDLFGTINQRIVPFKK